MECKFRRDAKELQSYVSIDWGEHFVSEIQFDDANIKFHARITCGMSMVITNLYTGDLSFTALLMATVGLWVVSFSINDFLHVPQITGLRASTNNRASTVLDVFLDAIEEYKMPFRVRGDRGGANKAVSVYMILAKGLNRASFLWGSWVVRFLFHSIMLQVQSFKALTITQSKIRSIKLYKQKSDKINSEKWNNRVSALPLIRFQIMNSVNRSTGYSCFQSLLGRSPRVIPLTEKINYDVQDAKDHLIAKIVQDFYATKGRSADDNFQVRDKVMLITPT